MASSIKLSSFRFLWVTVFSLLLQACVDQTGGNDKAPSPTPTNKQELPDLVVTNISYSPSTIAMGNAVIFSATIKNQGAVATPSGIEIGIGFKVDGNIASWASSTIPLVPGDYRETKQILFP